MELQIIMSLIQEKTENDRQVSGEKAPVPQMIIMLFFLTNELIFVRNYAILKESNCEMMKVQQYTSDFSHKSKISLIK